MNKITTRTIVNVNGEDYNLNDFLAFDSMSPIEATDSIERTRFEDREGAMSLFSDLMAEGFEPVAARLITLHQYGHYNADGDVVFANFKRT